MFLPVSVDCPWNVKASERLACLKINFCSGGAIL